MKEVKGFQFILKHSKIFAIHLKDCANFRKLSWIDITDAKFRFEITLFFIFMIYVPPSLMAETFNGVFDIFR